MERTKNENKPLWKKITPGVLYPFPDRRNRMVKPGESIRATQDELEKFSDDFELVENGKKEFKIKDVKKVKSSGNDEEEKIPSEPKEEYTVEHSGAGWYNVLSPAGKVMNDSKLRQDVAKELKAELDREIFPE